MDVTASGCTLGGQVALRLDPDLGLGLVLHLCTQAGCNMCWVLCRIRNERRCFIDSSFRSRHSGVPAMPSSC